MSKHTPKIYAQALADLNKKNDVKKMADNFLKLLERNGDMKKVGQIIAMTEKMLLKKTGNKKVVLETARNVSTENFVKAFVKKGDVVEEKINPALLAGVKIIVDENKQLDMSLLHKLNNIF